MTEVQATQLPDHTWLQRLVGEWTYEVTAPATADGPAETQTGTQRAWSLGGAWVVVQFDGAMPDGRPTSNLLTLGFDTTRGRFVGTFVSSMMHHMWLYEGKLDVARRCLVLATEGPSMRGDGSLAAYRDTVEIVDDDHWTLTSHYRADDGTWQEVMTMRQTRVG